MRGHAKEMREETREHPARLRSCCTWMRGNADDWRPCEFRFLDIRRHSAGFLKLQFIFFYGLSLLFLTFGGSGSLRRAPALGCTGCSMRIDSGIFSSFFPDDRALTECAHLTGTAETKGRPAEAGQAARRDAGDGAGSCLLSRPTGSPCPTPQVAACSLRPAHDPKACLNFACPTPELARAPCT